jgi:hypothetical protein
MSIYSWNKLLTTKVLSPATRMAQAAQCGLADQDLTRNPDLAFDPVRLTGCMGRLRFHVLRALTATLILPQTFGMPFALESGYTHHRL